VSEAIVDVRDLRKVYRSWSWGRRREVHALRGVSLRAEAGEVFGLLGPNGAGKTTMIKTLLGVVRPSGGSATLFDLPAGSVQARQRVGYLPESLRVDRHHTARSALRYYGRMSRMAASDINRRSDELLELVGLRGRDKESVRRFSKGMYQRLGLAQALMHDPSLLVLDEPTDGLDPVGRNEVRQVIQRLSESGKTIFLNSHILQEVELVCTRVAVMSLGEIKAIGTIDDLANAGNARTDRAGPVSIRFVNETLQSPGQVRSLIEADQAASQMGEQGIDVTEITQGTETTRASGDTQGSSDPWWTVKVSLPDQAACDRLVDRLRAADCSIVYLETKQASLEETFIRLVNQPSSIDNPTNVINSEESA